MFVNNDLLETTRMKREARAPTFGRCVSSTQNRGSYRFGINSVAAIIQSSRRCKRSAFVATLHDELKKRSVETKKNKVARCTVNINPSTPTRSMSKCAASLLDSTIRKSPRVSNSNNTTSTPIAVDENSVKMGYEKRLAQQELFESPFRPSFSLRLNRTESDGTEIVDNYKTISTSNRSALRQRQREHFPARVCKSTSSNQCRLKKKHDARKAPVRDNNMVFVCESNIKYQDCSTENQTSPDAINATEESSCSDHSIILTNKNMNQKSVVIPSTLPNRIRIPTNFYTDATTAITTKKGYSKKSKHIISTTSTSTLQSDNFCSRPKRKRIPTNFYKPLADDTSTLMLTTSTSHTSTSHNDNQSSNILQWVEVEETPLRRNTSVKTTDSCKNKDDESHYIPTTYKDLLSKYEQHAAHGFYQHVDFGNSIASAITAIDVKLHKLKRKKFNDTVDMEIVADIREYRRSLRAFSVYEDREKLALASEIQDNLILFGRQYAANRSRRSTLSMNSNNLDDINRAMIVSSNNIHYHRKMSLRNTSSQCTNGRECIFGCQSEKWNHNASIFSQNHLIAPIPPIKQFNIEHDDEEGDKEETISFSSKQKQQRVSSTRKRNAIHLDDKTSPELKIKATIEALSELKTSLHFIESYEERSPHFSMSIPPKYFLHNFD